MNPITMGHSLMADRTKLAVWDYPQVPLAQAATVVILVHGLGEHQGRYKKVAQQLNQWGYAVRSYDHIGHGVSGGVRGAVARPMQMVDHLAELIALTRSKMAANAKLVVLGHSLGGLVAARTALEVGSAIDALVLSSPALDAGMSSFQRFLVATLPYLAPNLRVGNGLDLNDLSHDETVVQAYRDDPLCHDRISARLAQFIAAQGRYVVGRAGAWTLPTLLLYSGQDKCVSPLGSQSFAQNAPKDCVSSSVFHSLKHEIFNELDPAPVFDVLRGWLALHCPIDAPV